MSESEREAGHGHEANEQKPPEEMTWEDEGGPVLPPGIHLTLRGPDGGDLEAALEAARAVLPEGYRLERD